MVFNYDLDIQPTVVAVSFGFIGAVFKRRSCGLLSGGFYLSIPGQLF